MTADPDGGAQPQMVTADVAGGQLTAAVWGPGVAHQGGPRQRPGAPVILAVHGITASHLAWLPVARWLADSPGPDLTLIAPDLRGRGASSDLPGPYGLAGHAADLVALLDAVGVDQAVVVGHSMGGFVALVLAHLYPARVGRLVLVDGGLPLPLPAAADPRDALESLVGPAARRLSMTFADPEAYRRYWRAHPALQDWTPDLAAYVDYDLVGTPPAMHSRTSAAAVRADSIDMGTGPAAREALVRLRHPARFLRAERGMLDEPTALYDRAEVEGWVRQLPSLTAADVASTNHYTILFSPAGAAAVAAAIRLPAS